MTNPREILFRGLCPSEDGKITVCIDGFKCRCEWIYGGCYIGKTAPFIVVKNRIDRITEMMVLPGTVGQYTGLKDKNGQRIFEGDIVMVKHPNINKAVLCLVEYGRFTDVDSNDNYDYVGWNLTVNGKHASILQPEADFMKIEIIGNIHENPRWLEARNYDLQRIFTGMYGEISHNFKPLTNGDRIRGMTDEELAVLLCDINDCNGKCPGLEWCHFGHKGLIDWIKQEAYNYETNTV